MHESSDNLANINHFQSLLDMGFSLNFNLDIMNKVDCVELGHYSVGFMDQASHAV